MSRNSYAPPQARVADTAAAVPRVFSWRDVVLFATRFAGAAAVSISMSILAVALMRAHERPSFEQSLRINIAYSVLLGIITLIWIWVIAAITAFFARISCAGRGLLSVACGVLFALLTNGIILGLGKLGMRMSDSALITGAWAIVFPIAVTLFLMRPKSA